MLELLVIILTLLVQIILTLFISFLSYDLVWLEYTVINANWLQLIVIKWLLCEWNKEFREPKREEWESVKAEEKKTIDLVPKQKRTHILPAAQRPRVKSPDQKHVNEAFQFGKDIQHCHVYTMLHFQNW